MTFFSKQKLPLYAIFLTAFLISVSAACLCWRESDAQTDIQVNVSYITRSHAFLQNNYLDGYSVSVDTDKEEFILSYSMNGGNYGSNIPSKAFDGNFDTFWETNTVNSASFKNQITVEFNKTVLLDKIAFATRRDGQWQKGFPLTATFYLSEDGTEFTLLASAAAEVKNNVILYTFSQPFSAKYFRFEYTDIYTGMTQHASASELIFFKPEEEIVQQVRNIFSDYAHTKLVPEYNNRTAIASLQEQLKDHPLYKGDLETILDRALSILDGTLMTDYVNRQFTTDPDARGVFLQQRGDIFNYGQKLHFMFGLSNYMPTGIFGNSGEQITVYVEADEGQPLPKLVFTQFLTTYQYWQGGQIQLSRGVNVLTVPNFTYTASYTNAGGPLYLVNPYTSQQQNKSVKVYIKGGKTFPVFYMGGSEEKLQNDLIDYAEYYHLSFNGVTFDTSDEYYDARVEKLFLSVRVMLPFSSAADAYATGQHVGIRINTGWETTALQRSGFGWETSHEIGHIIEIGEYRVLEYTNNMVSNFNETILDGKSSRGDHNKIRNLLAPDSILDKDGIASGPKPQLDRCRRHGDQPLERGQQSFPFPLHLYRHYGHGQRWRGLCGC